MTFIIAFDSEPEFLDYKIEFEESHRYRRTILLGYLQSAQRFVLSMENV